MTLATFLDLLINIFFAGIAGALVYALFRYYYRGLPTIQMLDISIIPACVLTAFLFSQFSVWPALSIILVLVFGIIHFRTVISDLTDLIFVFWALLSGILIGAGLDFYILLSNLLITLVGILIIKMKQQRQFYLFLIRYETDIEVQLNKKLEPLQAIVQEQLYTDDLCDLTLKLPEQFVDLDLIDEISQMKGVHQALMVQSDSFR